MDVELHASLSLSDGEKGIKREGELLRTGILIVEFWEIF